MDCANIYLLFIQGMNSKDVPIYPLSNAGIKLDEVLYMDPNMRQPVFVVSCKQQHQPTVISAFVIQSLEIKLTKPTTYILATIA